MSPKPETVNGGPIYVPATEHGDPENPADWIDAVRYYGAEIERGNHIVELRVTFKFDGTDHNGNLFGIIERASLGIFGRVFPAQLTDDVQVESWYRYLLYHAFYGSVINRVSPSGTPCQKVALFLTVTVLSQDTYEQGKKQESRRRRDRVRKRKQRKPERYRKSRRTVSRDATLDASVAPRTKGLKRGKRRKLSSKQAKSLSHYLARHLLPKEQKRHASSVQRGAPHTRLELTEQERSDRTLEPLLASAIKTRKLACFDTEDDSSGSFLCGSIVYRDDTGNIISNSYTDRLAMAQAFYSKRFRGYWFFAHNLLYDLRNIWGLKFPGTESKVGGTLYSASLCVRKRTIWRRNKPVHCREYIHFCDSTRHYPGSLAAIGKLIGNPKQELSCHPRDLLPAQRQAYCEQDAKVLLDFVERLQSGYNELGTSLNRTIGSTALECWRRRDQTRSIVQPDRQDLETLGLAYYGGRTEAFYIGTFPRPIDVGDVNSMYPSIMRDMVVGFPSRDNLWRRKKPSSFVLQRPGASHCLVQVPETFYPVLPKKYNGKLVFPCGHLDGWWTHNELNYAISQGTNLIDIRESIWFDDEIQPWKDFVDRSYAYRMEGGFKNLIGKLLGNNLYGKYNQRNPVDTIIGPEDWFSFASKDHDDTKPIRILRDPITDELCGFLSKSEELSFPVHSNMIWGAYITAGARIRLHKELVALSGLYCDTDSVMTEATVPESKAIGVLALKLHSEQGIVIRGPKAYHFPGSLEYTLKGVPCKAGFYSIGDSWYPCSNVRKMAFEGYPISYEAPTRMMTPFSRKTLPAIVDGTLIPSALPSGANIWYANQKELAFASPKRILSDSGYTYPVVLKDF